MQIVVMLRTNVFREIRARKKEACPPNKPKYAHIRPAKAICKNIKIIMFAFFEPK